jgi:hypothetical protein
LRYQRAESFRFLLPLVPVRAQMLYPLDVSKQEFLYFARFVFLSAQLLDLDAQQVYFPPHYRYWIGRVRIGRRGRAHEGMNVRNSGLIRHAQSVPKRGLQTVNGGRTAERMGNWFSDKSPPGPAPVGGAVLPVPETKPGTIEGWTVREVAGGTLLLEGPNGQWRATSGETVPGL